MSIHRQFQLSYNRYVQILDFTVPKYPFLFAFHVSVDILMMIMLFEAHFFGQCLEPEEGWGQTESIPSILPCELPSIVGPMKPLNHWGLGSGSLLGTSVQGDCPLTFSNMPFCPEVVGKMEGRRGEWRKLEKSRWMPLLA